MKVIFSHGKESGPWGTKIRILADIAKAHGHEVDSIDYTGIISPDERAGKLITILADITQPVILVGSSMGGYVSLVASEHYNCEGLFMLAPALCMPDYAKQSYASMAKNICVVHGLSDDIIPYQHSQQYAQASGCDLHLIEGDHRLNSSLNEVCGIFEKFLEQY
jgi:surfactin synthase thioesterase subunit